MWRPKKIVSYVLIVLILVGLWSTQAMPGSFFYTYKTTVNEPLRKAVNFTRERRAMFEVTILERRLREVEELIRENKLDDAKFMAWERAFVDSVYVVTGRIVSLTNADGIMLAHAVAAEQYAVIEGYVYGFSLMTGQNEEATKKVVDLITPYAKDAQTTELEVREQVLKYLGKQQFLGKVEGQITEVVAYANETKELFEATSSKLSTDVATSLTAHQQAIDKHIFEAKEQRARDFYPEAGIEIQKAHAASRMLRIIVSVAQHNI